MMFIEISRFGITEAGALSTLMLPAVASGSITGGTLADRTGRKRIMMTSTLISLFFISAIPLLGDSRAFLCSAVIGFGLWCGVTIYVGAGTKSFPKKCWCRLGVALGFAFVVGGEGLQLTGRLAEP